MVRTVAHLAAERTHRAAVRDDQDPPAEVRAGDPLDRRVHPLAMLVARLAVGPVAVREPLRELGARQSGPRADVDLAQAASAITGTPCGAATISAVSCARDRSLE